jgi:hypothetical protein
LSVWSDVCPSLTAFGWGDVTNQLDTVDCKVIMMFPTRNRMLLLRLANVEVVAHHHAIYMSPWVALCLCICKYVESQRPGMKSGRE